MLEKLKLIFDPEVFMPHGHCYFWKPTLVGLHVISDGLISIAYAFIPLALLYILNRRKDIPFDWMIVCFGLFIVLCGITHLMEIVTVWKPLYWFSGVIKLVTAIVSVITAVLLVRLIPLILSLPSHLVLKKANEDLSREIEERKRIEQEMVRLEQEPRRRERERLEELERFQKMTVGRELKMIELKKENEELKRRLGLLC